MALVVRSQQGSLMLFESRARRRVRQIQKGIDVSILRTQFAIHSNPSRPLMRFQRNGSQIPALSAAAPIGCSSFWYFVAIHFRKLGSA
jgi:hypothetical protein